MPHARDGASSPTLSSFSFARKPPPAPPGGVGAFAAGLRHRDSTETQLTHASSSASIVRRANTASHLIPDLHLPPPLPTSSKQRVPSSVYSHPASHYAPSPNTSRRQKLPAAARVSDIPEEASTRVPSQRDFERAVIDSLVNGTPESVDFTGREVPSRSRSLRASGQATSRAEGRQSGAGAQQTVLGRTRSQASGRASGSVHTHRDPNGSLAERAIAPSPKPAHSAASLLFAPTAPTNLPLTTTPPAQLCTCNHSKPPTVRTSKFTRVCQQCKGLIHLLAHPQQPLYPRTHLKISLPDPSTFRSANARGEMVVGTPPHILVVSLQEAREREALMRRGRATGSPRVSDSQANASRMTVWPGAEQFQEDERSSETATPTPTNGRRGDPNRITQWGDFIDPLTNPPTPRAPERVVDKPLPEVPSPGSLRRRTVVPPPEHSSRAPSASSTQNPVRRNLPMPPPPLPFNDDAPRPASSIYPEYGDREEMADKSLPPGPGYTRPPSMSLESMYNLIPAPLNSRSNSVRSVPDRAKRPVRPEVAPRPEEAFQYPPAMPSAAIINVHDIPHIPHPSINLELTIDDVFAPASSEDPKRTPHHPPPQLHAVHDFGDPPLRRQTPAPGVEADEPVVDVHIREAHTSIVVTRRLNERTIEARHVREARREYDNGDQGYEDAAGRVWRRIEGERR